jgi:enoyl-[acyl-carrier-protein] reductase (NADH)
LSLVEFTLLQSEVDDVNQYLLDNHWTVTAIHNHHFFENPRLIYLHAEKQDSLDNVLHEIRNAWRRLHVTAHSIYRAKIALISFSKDL